MRILALSEIRQNPISNLISFHFSLIEFSKLVVRTFTGTILGRCSFVRMKGGGQPKRYKQVAAAPIQVINQVLNYESLIVNIPKPRPIPSPRSILFAYRTNVLENCIELILPFKVSATVSRVVEEMKCLQKGILFKRRLVPRPMGIKMKMKKMKKSLDRMRLELFLLRVKSSQQ